MVGTKYLRGLKTALSSYVAGRGGVDLITYVGQINNDGCAMIHGAVRQRKQRSARVVLWISTTGGDANAGYRIARCLQENYENYEAYISTVCKSAGTLIVIGAHSLVMSDEGELGPLDIQIQKRDELWEYGSGLDSLEALDVLKSRALAAFRDHVMEMRENNIPTKIAAEVARHLTVGLLSPIAAQLDPVSLGETHRRLRITQEYSMRLDKKPDNLKMDALEALLTGYPSHGFVIDRREAETLFSHVRGPSAAEASLFDSLSRLLRIGRKACNDEPRALVVNDLIAKLPTDEDKEDQDGNVDASTAPGDEETRNTDPGPSAEQIQQAGNGNGSTARTEGQKQNGSSVRGPADDPGSSAS